MVILASAKRYVLATVTIVSSSIFFPGFLFLKVTFSLVFRN